MNPQSYHEASGNNESPFNARTRVRRMAEHFINDAIIYAFGNVQTTQYNQQPAPATAPPFRLVGQPQPVAPATPVTNEQYIEALQTEEPEPKLASVTSLPQRAEITPSTNPLFAEQQSLASVTPLPVEGEQARMQREALEKAMNIHDQLKDAA